MGTLTPFLQREFRRRCPPGWECTAETTLLPPDLTDLLGYAPPADVVLTDTTARARLWVEFEVSRADPVANHAKFATAHLFRPQAPADHFVAMLSPHIDRGRRNLAAASIRLMRRVGMSAFQTTLLPPNPPAGIQRLNRLPVEELAVESIDVSAEIDRLLAVVTPVGQWGRAAVHFAGDLLDVMLNIRGWNDDLGTADGRRAWGRRVVTDFVFDTASGLFAPSKFSAYTPVLPGADWHRMTTPAYAELNDGTRVMDGQRAWKHLTRGLGMRALAADAGGLGERFARWLTLYPDAVAVQGGTPTLLVPPEWYARKTGSEPQEAE